MSNDYRLTRSTDTEMNRLAIDLAHAGKAFKNAIVTADRDVKDLTPEAFNVIWTAYSVALDAFCDAIGLADDEAGRDAREAIRIAITRSAA